MIPLKTIDTIVASIRQDIVDRNLKSSESIDDSILMCQLFAMAGIANCVIATNQEKSLSSEINSTQRWTTIAEENIESNNIIWSSMMSFILGHTWALTEQPNKLVKLSNDMKDFDDSDIYPEG